MNIEELKIKLKKELEEESRLRKIENEITKQREKFYKSVKRDFLKFIKKHSFKVSSSNNSIYGNFGSFTISLYVYNECHENYKDLIFIISHGKQSSIEYSNEMFTIRHKGIEKSYNTFKELLDNLEL